MKYHIVDCSEIYYLLSILGTTSKLSGHYVADSIGSMLVQPGSTSLAAFGGCNPCEFSPFLYGQT